MKSLSSFALSILFFFSLTPIFAGEKTSKTQELFTKGDYFSLIQSVKNQTSPPVEDLYIAGVSSLLTAQNALALEFLQQIDVQDRMQFPLYSFWMALIEIENGNIQAAQGLLDMALTQKIPLSSKQIVQATLAGLNGGTLHDQQSGSAILMYARARQVRGDHAMALNALAQILESQNSQLIPYALFSQGRSYESLSRKDEAMAKYQLIISLYPSHPMVSAAQYAILRLTQAPITREKLLSDIAKQKLPSLERQLAKTEIAKSLYEKSDNSGLTDLSAMESSEAEKNILLYIRGLALAKSGQLEKAVNILSAIKPDQTNQPQVYAYAQAYYLEKMNENTKALKILDGLTLSDSEDEFSDILKLKVLIMKKLGMAHQLNETLKSMDVNKMKDLQTLSFYYLSKGWGLLQSGDLSGSLATYATLDSLTTDPQILIEAKYNSGLAYSRKKEFIRAEEFFHQAMQLSDGQLSPKERESIMLAQAVSSYQANQPNKSLQFGGQALASSSNPLPWYILMAASYTQLQDFSNAVGMYEKITLQKHYNNTEDARYLWALSLYRAGNVKAHELLKELSTTAKHPYIQQASLFWLGHTNAMLGKWPVAEKLYAQALALKVSAVPTYIKIPEQEIQTALLLAMFKTNNPALSGTLAQLKSQNMTLSSSIYYTLAKEAIIEKQYTKAIDFLDQIQDKKLKKSALFDQGQYLEASRKKNEAIKLYMMYLSMDGSSAQSLVVARKLSKLLDAKQLEKWVFSSETELSTKVKAPLVLSWIELAKSADSAKVDMLVQNLPLEELDDLERSEISLTQARYFKRSKNYTKALETYDRALNLVISPQQYFLARKERSEIYEEQGSINDAVKELLLVEQTFRNYPQIAAEALYEASLIFQRHQMRAQYSVIQKTLKERYPDTPQGSRI